MIEILDPTSEVTAQAIAYAARQHAEWFWRGA